MNDLTDETLLPLVAEAKGGDREALEQLIKLVMPELRRRLGRRSSVLCDADDQSSVAMRLIWDAVYIFDPAQGCPFVAYIINHLPLRIADDIRRDIGAQHQRAGRSVPLSELTRDEIEKVERPDPAKPVVEMMSLREQVDKVLSTLVRPDAQLLRLIYLEGKTYEEAADAIGRTTSWVTSRVSYILRTFRKENPELAKD